MSPAMMLFWLAVIFLVAGTRDVTEIERLKEKVETLKARLNAYYGECKPCSRCQGTGKDPEIKNCTCDCCEGTGWEVDA